MVVSRKPLSFSPILSVDTLLMMLRIATVAQALATDFRC